MNYMHTDIPAGVTIAAYRRSRPRKARRAMDRAARAAFRKTLRKVI